MVVFWTKNPHILLNSKYIKQIFPTNKMNNIEKYNAISRLIIILSIIGYFITKNVIILFVGIFTLISISILYNSKHHININVKEGFTDLNYKNPKEVDHLPSSDLIKSNGNGSGTFSDTNSTKKDVFQEVKDGYTLPSVNNPIMNVLMTDYIDNPQRGQAAPCFNPKIEKHINLKTKDFILSDMQNYDPNQQTTDDLYKRMFNDLGNEMTFEQSMRPFHSTANTQIPNDQSGFANYLYGNMPSCKDGDGIQCIKNNRRYNLY